MALTMRKGCEHSISDMDVAGHVDGLCPLCLQTALAAANDRVAAMAEVLCKLLIYQVEGDEWRVWLRFDGLTIVGINASTKEATALLQLEAQRKAAIDTAA